MKRTHRYYILAILIVVSLGTTSCEILSLNTPDTAGPNENIEVSTEVQYFVPVEGFIQQVFIAIVPDTWDVVSASHSGEPSQLNVTFSSTPPSDLPSFPPEGTCDATEFIENIEHENPDLPPTLDGLQVIYFVTEEFAPDALMNGDTATLTVVFSQGANSPTGEVPVFFACAQVVQDVIDQEDVSGCFANLGENEDANSTEIAFINIISSVVSAPVLNNKGLAGLIAALLIIGYFSLRRKKEAEA